MPWNVRSAGLIIVAAYLITLKCGAEASARLCMSELERHVRCPIFVVDFIQIRFPSRASEAFVD